jgi:hypothetical protein
MPCLGLELFGGRVGVHGKVDPVPLKSHVPEWLVPNVLKHLEAQGARAPSSSVPGGHMAIEPWLKFVELHWPPKAPQEPILRALKAAEAEARQAMAARQGDTNR